MAETRFVVPQGELDLIRYPPTRNASLRAWDAADELLLSHLWIGETTALWTRKAWPTPRAIRPR